MDLLVGLGIFGALAWTFRWLFQWCSPLLSRTVDKLALRGVRTVHRVLWFKPARELGTGATLWLWLIVFASMLTLASLCTLDPRGLPCVLFFWALVGLGWWLLRWQAQRRYQVRRLPRRRDQEVQR